MTESKDSLDVSKSKTFERENVIPEKSEPASDHEQENEDLMNRVKRQERMLEVEKFHQMQKFGETNLHLQKVLNEPYCPPPMFFHNNPET